MLIEQNIIHKSITAVEKGFVLHGCNAQGVMNSGVAKAIRNTWPEAYEAYIEVYISTGLNIGMFIAVPIDPRLYIINLITQVNYGYNGKRFVDYDAIKTSCKAAKIYMDQEDPQKTLPVCYPKIGAGLGGGDWATICPIITDIFNDRENYLYVP